MSLRRERRRIRSRKSSSISFDSLEDRRVLSASSLLGGLPLSLPTGSNQIAVLAPTLPTIPTSSATIPPKVTESSQSDDVDSADLPLSTDLDIGVSSAGLPVDVGMRVGAGPNDGLSLDTAIDLLPSETGATSIDTDISLTAEPGIPTIAGDDSFTTVGPTLDATVGSSLIVAESTPGSTDLTITTSTNGVDSLTQSTNLAASPVRRPGSDLVGKATPVSIATLDAYFDEEVGSDLSIDEEGPVGNHAGASARELSSGATRANHNFRGNRLALAARLGESSITDLDVGEKSEAAQFGESTSSDSAQTVAQQESSNASQSAHEIGLSARPSREYADEALDASGTIVSAEALSEVYGADFIGLIGTDPNGTANDAYTFSSEEAGLLAGGVPFDAASMQEALQQFLRSLESVNEELGNWWAGLGIQPWMVVTLAAAVFAGEVARRNLAQIKRRLAVDVVFAAIPSE